MYPHILFFFFGNNLNSPVQTFRPHRSSYSQHLRCCILFLVPPCLLQQVVAQRIYSNKPHGAY